ncbi:MAG: helix-turn-helix domain-containing protein [Phycisphaerales bacterium]|nr:helix-turn-helix domain-containing protein [Phycisphaerales bacterium]
MPKSLFTSEYDTLRRLLREARERAGVTQTDLAERLGLTQSVVSKCERGERRLDVIELRAWCHAIGVSLTEFAQRLEGSLPRPRAPRTKRGR